METLKAGTIYVEAMTDTERIFRNARRLGLNALTIPVRIFMKGQTSPDVSIDVVSRSRAITLIKQAHENGLKVILEPFPWLNDGTVETEFKPTDVDQFFLNWKDVLRELCQTVAERYNVYALNTCPNFHKMEYATEYWKDVFSFVRNHYGGLITYRTNWWYDATWDIGPGSTTEAYEQKLNNELFGDVDFISIAAYFELTDVESPTVIDLKNALYSVQKHSRGQNIYQEIKNFYELWEKPIFLGELGAPSKRGAANEPWSDHLDQPDDYLTQAYLFQAYGEVFAEEEWFKGFSVWQISDPNSYYYPIDKIAEKAIYNFYGNLYPSDGGPRRFGDMLYNLLPEIYKREDAKVAPIPYPLKRFFQVASVGFDYLAQKIEGRRNLYDVDNTPAEFLPYLYRMLGFPFPSFLTEEEQRSFLKILPTLIRTKGTKSVFQYLGRTFYGINTIVLPEPDNDGITINLNVEVDGSIRELDQCTQRFLFFAHMFRPINKKLAVIVNIVYTDKYDVKPSEFERPAVLSFEDTEDSYDREAKVDEIYEAVVLSDVDTDSYNKAQMDDNYLTDEITFVDTPETYGKTKIDDLFDEQLEKSNKLGRGQLGDFRLGD